MLWYSCFFFKQKTAYEMRISDWSSDVCSSDLPLLAAIKAGGVNAMAHITGGGLPDNLPRVLPEGHGADLDVAGWDLNPVFRWQIGRASCRERVCQYV